MSELLQGSDYGPARFGPYRRVRELGAGAMGAVLEVEDERTGARYALKVILPDALDADTLARFQREARAMGQLNHPHVARIHAAQLEPPLRYLVLDLYPGGTLRERIQRGPLPWPHAAGVLAGLADGVAHAHAQGVLHRDIKPANVLFDDQGQAVLSDFGLARAGDASRMTRTGELLGTPLYMAPEQVIDGKRTGPAADVYALGALLYLTLTGRPPIESGLSLLETLDKVVTQVPTPPSELVPELPPELDRVCRRALAKEPELRPSAAELARELAPFAPESALVAGGGRRGPSRRALLPLIACALLALLAGALGASWLRAAPAEPGAEPSTDPEPTEVARRAEVPGWIQALDERDVALSVHREGRTLTLLARSSLSFREDGWSWSFSPRAVRAAEGELTVRAIEVLPPSHRDAAARACSQLCAAPTVLRFDARNRVESATSVVSPAPLDASTPALVRLADAFTEPALLDLGRDLIGLQERRGTGPHLNRAVVSPEGDVVAAVRSRPEGWDALVPVELARDQAPRSADALRRVELPGGAIREVFEGLLLASNALDDPDHEQGDPWRSFEGWLELPRAGADARLRGVRPPFTVLHARDQASAYTQPYGSPLGALLPGEPYLQLEPASGGWIPIAWQGGEAWVPQANAQEAPGKPWVGVVVVKQGGSLNVRYRAGDTPLARPRLGSLRPGQVVPLGAMQQIPSVAVEYDGSLVYAQTPPLGSWNEIAWGPRHAWLRASIPQRGGHEIYLFAARAQVESKQAFLLGQLPEQTVVTQDSTKPR